MIEPPADPLAALGALYMKGLTAFQSATAGNAGTSPDQAAMNPAAIMPGLASPALSAALTNSWRISAASALRYGQALVAVQMRYQAAIFHTMSDRATGQTAENLVLADDVRAFLREIGETAEREARHLQSELAQVSEALAQAMAQPSPTGTPGSPAKRAYRVKR
jgi:hypothetical protein